MSKVRTLLGVFWEYLREAAGENDYRRYRDSTLAAGEEPVSPQEFYLRQLQHTYSQINRCC